MFLFRLPTELPVHNRDSWTLHLAGDLGEGWDIEAEMSPVEGLVPIVANLRQPYASVMVWQPVREREPLFSLDAVQKVASTGLSQLPCDTRASRAIGTSTHCGPRIDTSCGAPPSLVHLMNLSWQVSRRVDPLSDALSSGAGAPT